MGMSVFRICKRERRYIKIHRAGIRPNANELTVRIPDYKSARAGKSVGVDAWRWVRSRSMISVLLLTYHHFKENWISGPSESILTDGTIFSETLTVMVGDTDDWKRWIKKLRTEGSKTGKQETANSASNNKSVDYCSLKRDWHIPSDNASLFIIYDRQSCHGRRKRFISILSYNMDM